MKIILQPLSPRFASLIAIEQSVILWTESASISLHGNVRASPGSEGVQLQTENN